MASGGVVAARFVPTLHARPRVKRLLSSDHFSVDGTMIQTWSSMNERHARLDKRPEAKLYRKGPGMEARLAFLGHALMENRHGLVVDVCLTQASGHAERLAALAMIESTPIALAPLRSAPTRPTTPPTS